MPVGDRSLPGDDSGPGLVALGVTAIAPGDGQFLGLARQAPEQDLVQSPGMTMVDGGAIVAGKVFDRWD